MPARATNAATADKTRRTTTTRTTSGTTRTRARKPAPVVQRTPPTEWSEVAWKEMEAYVNECASLIRLSDWTITLLDDDAGEDADASVNVTYGKKNAYIRFGQGFLKLKPSEQRQTICHELVHIHLYDIGHFFHKSFDEFVSAEAKRGLMIGYTLVDETATDVLADVIAPSLPLPWGL